MANTPKKKKQTKKKTPANSKAKKEKLQSANIPTLEDAYILIEPDRPDIWEKAGFGIKKGIAYIPKEKINLHTLYKAEGESEFYSASFFGGEIHTQLVPLVQLGEFLEAQSAIDDEQGKFYDLINLRENGRDMWGTGKNYRGASFSEMSESAEELLLKLTQYKRHGALLNEKAGGSFEYIQVCFIQLGV